MNNNEFEHENTAVNHPEHYNKSDSGVETIEIVRYLDFDCGNALKYLMRFRYKQKPREDLEKAIWYLKDKHYYTALRISVDRLNHNINVPYNEEVYQFILAVVRAETNIYVRNAMTLIAEYATFGAPIFVEPYSVICELEDHIDDVLKEERNAEQDNQLLEAAGKLFAAVEESDNKETPQETWEKSKQNGVLQSLYHNRKSVFDDSKSESNSVDILPDGTVDLFIDNITGKVIPLGVELYSYPVIKHVPFVLNEQAYKVLKDSTKNYIEFRAAAYKYAANIYERSVQQDNQMMEDAGKLFAAVVESDNKETPKETWEKSKQKTKS